MQASCALYIANLDRLGSGATHSPLCGVVPEVSSKSDKSVYTYRWSDLTVVFSEMPTVNVPGHLTSFEQHIRGRFHRDSTPQWVEDLVSRIKSSSLVVGVVASPDFDVEKRAEAIVGVICDKYKAMMFFADHLYDWDGTVLFEPNGSRS